MKRLTEKDDLGNWCLKGVRWEQLRAGQVITKEVGEKLYGALCKLRDYEDTGCSPDDVIRLDDFEQSNTSKLLKQLNGEYKKHRWIPVEERLPEENKYVLLSFYGLEEPAFGMYEENEWYLGYAYGGEKCISVGLLVSAWLPLPEPYGAEVEEKPDVSTDWKGHYMGRFEKVE